MNSGIGQKGMIKLSLEDLKAMNMDNGKLMLQISIGFHKKQLVDLNFKQRRADINQFFIFSVQSSSNVSFTLSDIEKQTKVAQCSFPITKFCSYPKIRHSLEVQLIQISSKSSFGILKCELLYMTGVLGKLSLQFQNLQTIDKVNNHQVIVEVNNQKKQIFRDISSDFIINAQKQIMQIRIIDKQQNQLLGFKEIDIFEEDILRPSSFAIKRPFYISHKGTTIGNIFLKSKFSFINSDRSSLDS